MLAVVPEGGKLGPGGAILDREGFLVLDSDGAPVFLLDLNQLA